VNAESIFLSEISKLKRRVFSRFVYRILLWSFVIFLGSYAILFFITEAGFSGRGNYGPWTVILIGISLIAAIMVAILERKSFQFFLIDIDTRRDLRDSLSTAYEYHRSGNKSVFSDLLMQDAAVKLRQLNTRQIFPAKFSRLHLLLILVLMTGMALFSSVYYRSGFSPVPVDPRKIEKARTLVRDFTRSDLAVSRSKKAKANDVIDNKIEQLRKTLNDPSITRDELFASLNRHLKEIQGEQSRQAAELDARLDDANILNMPIQDSPDLQSLKAGQLEKLKKLLHQALNHQIPDGIHENMESLQELFSLEKLLSQVIDEFHEGDSGPRVSADSRRYQKPMSSSPQDLGKKNDDSFQPKAGGQSSVNAEDGGADIPGRSRSDSSQSDGFDAPGEWGLSQGSSPQAGNAISSGREKPGSELEKAPGPEIQDKVMSAQVRHYLMRIRSLATVGESKLKEEEIVRVYQQEIEGVLQKEDIPLNYRNYIKHYFLSIGIETAEGSP